MLVFRKVRLTRNGVEFMIPRLPVLSWVLSVVWGVASLLVLGGLLMGGLAAVAWVSFVGCAGLSVWFGYLFMEDVSEFVDECLDVWVEGGEQES